MVVQEPNPATYGKSLFADRLTAIQLKHNKTADPLRQALVLSELLDLGDSRMERSRIEAMRCYAAVCYVNSPDIAMRTKAVGKLSAILRGSFEDSEMAEKAIKIAFGVYSLGGLTPAEKKTIDHASGGKLNLMADDEAGASKKGKPRLNSAVSLPKPVRAPVASQSS